MDLKKLKEEFEDMKAKYKWTEEYQRGHFVIPKYHMDAFLHGLDYVLEQQEKKQQKAKKKKSDKNV